MPRKQKNKPKKSWFQRYFWRTLIAFGALCAIGTLTYINSTKQIDITHVKLDTITPNAQSFLDTNNALFTSENGIPAVNNNRTLEHIAPVVISYQWESGPYSPAFTMGLNKKDLNKYVKISPIIRGNFELMGQNTIKFTPDTPWPADTRFTIRMSKNLFDTDVRPDDYSATFTTPKITANIDSFNTYHDKSNPQSMIAVAIISYNYPIDTDHFADKVLLKRDGEKLNFAVKFDRFHRTAFIISPPVIL